MYILAQNQGSIVTISNLASEIRLSEPAIQYHLELLAQTFVCFPLYSYSGNLANELKKVKKFYLYDLGIRNSLLNDFSSIEKNSEHVHQRNVGIRGIPIDKIVGSLGRYNDFIEGFLPKKERISAKYESVKQAMLDEKVLPPIKVYKVLDNYFVIDGHHRGRVTPPALRDLEQLGESEFHEHCDGQQIHGVPFLLNCSLTRARHRSASGRRFPSVTWQRPSSAPS